MFSIDLTERLKQRSQREKIVFKKCNLTKDKIPFNENTFDVILFNEVFEHLSVSPNLVFNEISRVLKTGGILIFQTPNCTSLSNRMKLLFGFNIYEPPENMIGGGHFRIYTLRECINIFKKNKFEIKKAEFPMYINNMRALKFLKLPKVFSPFLLIYNFIVWFIPPFRNSIMIIGRNRK